MAFDMFVSSRFVSEHLVVLTCVLTLLSFRLTVETPHDESLRLFYLAQTYSSYLQFFF
jgi:ABC-type antimicrobial peptide transport system permease subunit